MQAKQSSLQNPNPKGQISSSSLLFDFAGVSSNNLFSEQNQSEIRNANERNFDHSFSSPPSVSRLGSEKPVMGTSSGLSKPRLVKLRKHFVSQQTRSTGKKVESGFNPFRPATDTLNDQWTSWNPFSSNSAQKSKSFTGSNDFEFLKPENSGFVFGVNDRSTDSNFKTNGLGENLGTSLPDEMTKLNIGRETNERVNLNSGKVSQKHEDESFVFNVGKSLPDEIRKMNIGKDTKEREVNLNSGEVYEKHENAGFAFAANDRSTDSNLRTSGLGENVGQSLPNEMRKLNIGRETKEGVVNLNSDEVSKNHGFVFGSSSKENPGLNENKVSKLPDEMRKLNIESSGVSDGGEKTKDTNFSSQVNGKNTFIFGRSNKIPDAVFQNTVFKLPHEMNELKIEDFGNASGVEKTKDASSSKTNDKNTFSSGGSMDFAGSMSGSSENTLPDDMKKLNIQGSRSGDEPEKTKNAFSQFDYKKAFGLESDKNNAGSYGGSTSSMLPGETEKLNIGSKTGDSGVFNDSTGGNSIPPFTFRAGVQGKSSGVESVPHSDSKLGEVPGFQSVGNTFEVPSMDGAENKAGFRFTSSQDSSGSFTGPVPHSDSKLGGASLSSSSFSSAAPGFQSVAKTFEVPFMDGAEKKTDFSFTSSQDGFRTPNFRAPKHDNLCSSMGNLTTEFNKKLEFSAKKAAKDSRLKKRKGKLKQNAPVHQWPGKDYVSRANSSQENAESPGSYSPMDFSPYQETLAADQFSREASVASDDFFHSDTKCASTDAHPSVSIDATDESLVTATENLNLNKDEELNEGRSYTFERGDGAKCPTEEFVSGDESECLRSTSEKVDTDNDVDASVATTRTEANISSNTEKKASDDRTQFCFASSSDNVNNANFTFAASPSAQANLSEPKHYCRKKNRRKVGQDSQIPSSNAKIHVASPCMPLFPLSGITSQSVPGSDKIEDSSISQSKEKEPVVKELFTSGGAAVAAAAQEACEKWRLRGNQAYAKGNLSKAEGYYTRGVNCVSRKEASKSCLKALVLCYSNRAAARMTLGRMREALGDCKEAVAIDPNFYKVQVRAANCHLALGEIEDALRYFKKCAQSGDVCLDRKVVIEASDGLHKAQKVAGYIDRSAELLEQRKFSDAENALRIIAEALLISPYSEKLVEMKAEALFVLRRYEEVLQLCDQTLASASLNANGQSENSDGPESIKNSRARLWCWCLIAKSYFNLGRLEEALDFLDKLEQVGFSAEKHGIHNLKSSISLSVTVRELLRHKAAGNEAFQSGKYSEAVEHYTAAVSCNVESRPFAAICFCNRAAASQAIGQITDAIADCSLAIALDGNYPKAISRRATLHEMIRDYGKAASDLQRLISLLEKQAEDKAKESGKLGRSTSIVNDLRQARMRLTTMEEEARKEIPLNMYLILGIEPSSEAADIKKAYRKAALRHHPDKAGQFLARTENGDDGLWKEIAEEVYRDADRLFKIIGEAYAILSDSDKRSRYDLEEEIRNSHKKGNGNSSSPRRSGYPSSSPYERRGSSRRQWQEFWESYQHSKGSDSSRSRSRYY
ncbi:Tetratricopeptide TPR-1 [Macleaya cordata]|uniref:Tetratricopeptide TPR-1 n=1 Tax=Macleaya cordata TaxID=56857 RepID=A0A200QRA2_MACCD|nr:Tetratricopeptide TPR-1 [Macleaya cordata]